MKEDVRKLDGLVLDGEDLFINGNLYVEGPIDIRNATIIICGDATFKSDNNIFMHYVDIIVAGDLLFNSKCIKVTGGGDISANQLNCKSNANYSFLNATDSDIYVKENIYAFHINADSIFVGKNTRVSSIKCTEIIINDTNDSLDISAVLDIYIGGDSSSFDLKARDIFIGGGTSCHNIVAQNLYIESSANFNGYGLTVTGNQHIGSEILNLKYIPARV